MIRILLIDDNENDHEILSMIFTERSQQSVLTHIKDGELAIRNLEGLPVGSPPPYELILLDLHLPRIYGLDILRFLKTDQRYAGIPAVILTTSDHATDREGARALQAQGYLIKPGDYKGYVELVDQLLTFATS